VASLDFKNKLYSRMPATHPQPANRPHRPTTSSTYAAIVVGVIIGVLGIVAILLFLWDRRRKHGVKKGFKINSQIEVPRSTSLFRGDKESRLEIGVIHEPLPVYQTEAMADEKRLGGASAGNASA
jgi:hypothetical protein